MVAVAACGGALYAFVGDEAHFVPYRTQMVWKCLGLMKGISPYGVTETPCVVGTNIYQKTPCCGGGKPPPYNRTATFVTPLGRGLPHF